MDLTHCTALSLLEIGLVFKLNSLSVEPGFHVLLVLIGVQYIALKLYRLLIWPIFISPLRNVPGPKDGNLLLGHGVKLYKSLPGVLERSWMSQFPDSPFIRYLSFANTEFLMVNSVQAHREVLQTKCYSFIKPPWVKRVIGEIAGHGILFMEGEEHKKNRRMLIGPFSFGNLKNLLPFFDVKAKEMTKIVSESLKEDLSNPIEVSELMSKTTLDIIGFAVLGSHLESLSTSCPFAESYQKIFEIITPLQVLISVTNQYVPVRNWLPFKVNKDYVKANAVVRQTLRDHVRRRRHDYKAGMFGQEKIVGRDLLSLIIEETKDSCAEEEILGYLLNFMSAGHETTAGALTWALYALTLHPKMQSRLRQEILAKLHSVSPSFGEIEGLNFLNNFTKEVLRYYPPAPSFTREAGQGVEICGIVIPKGTQLVIAPGTPHFNKHIWGPTADDFDPDRFENLPKAAQDPYASEAFSAGSRICIGKAMALLEFKTILVEFVRKFEFANTGPVQPQRGGVSLRPLEGLKLIVTPVSD